MSRDFCSLQSQSQFIAIPSGGGGGGGGELGECPPVNNQSGIIYMQCHVLTSVGRYGLLMSMHDFLCNYTPADGGIAELKYFVVVIAS